MKRHELALQLAELLRYGVASAAGLAVDFGLLVALTELFGLYYLASAAVGFCAGVGVVYLISVRWVFAHRRFRSRSSELSVFLLVGVAGLALNQLLMAGLTDGLMLHYQLSKLITVAVVFSFNFACRKLVLFRAPEGAEGTP
ncbi:MAG TPA: GtrA family protein [Woeseiaceae bacterium]|nr:GtrA family protein [Woeseiaceae bacterium]